MSEFFSKEDVIKYLADECEEVGGQSEWARKNKVRVDNLNSTLKGRRPPGGTILKALGFIRKTVYVTK